jgi:hypothetical protein
MALEYIIHLSCVTAGQIGSIYAGVMDVKVEVMMLGIPQNAPRRPPAVRDRLSAWGQMKALLTRASPAQRFGVNIMKK